MNTLTQKIVSARAEHVRLLNKATAYSPEFRKPAQIAFYTAFIKFIDDGLVGEAPKADLTNWNVMQCVLDAQNVTRV